MSRVATTSIFLFIILYLSQFLVYNVSDMSKISSDKTLVEATVDEENMILEELDVSIYKDLPIIYVVQGILASTKEGKYFKVQFKSNGRLTGVYSLQTKNEDELNETLEAMSSDLRLMTNQTIARLKVKTIERMININGDEILQVDIYH